VALQTASHFIQQLQQVYECAGCMSVMDLQTDIQRDPTMVTSVTLGGIIEVSLCYIQIYILLICLLTYLLESL